MGVDGEEKEETMVRSSTRDEVWKSNRTTSGFISLADGKGGEPSEPSPYLHNVMPIF